MGKGSKKDRARDLVAPCVLRPRPQRLTGPASEVPTQALATASAPHPATAPTPLPTPAPTPLPAPARRLTVAAAAALVGAKKIKKKCCRSRPRCKGCPAVLMRAARLHESGLAGKDLEKAVKRARAA